MHYDLTMYKKFKKLKETHTAVMVYISDADIYNAPKTFTPGEHVGYVKRRFEEKGLEVTRFDHDYKRNELGLVFMAGDSVINPGYEVWGLVGVNLKAKEQT